MADWFSRRSSVSGGNSSNSMEAPKKVVSLPASEDEYLAGLYERIVKYCKENNLPPPPKGIVEKTKMHVCAFDPDEGWRNGDYYAYLGTRACMPVPRGKDYREALQGAFNFPLHTNVGGAGAVVVPHLLKQDKFLLIKEWRPPIGRFSYNFPRGFADKVEKTINTAFRELKEESGIKVKVDKCLSLGRIYENNGCSYNAPEVFYAPIDGDVMISPENGASCVLMSDEDFYCGVEEGNKGDMDGIVDSFTLAAYMKAVTHFYFEKK